MRLDNSFPYTRMAIVYSVHELAAILLRFRLCDWSLERREASSTLSCFHILQVKFIMDEDTCLADLLALNLHNYEDEVRGIVDKATKELGMEKVLGELDVTWSAMEFEYETHQRTHISLLKSSEELIETLEDNQVQ